MNRVIVVDKDIIALQFIQTTLISNGYETEIYSNPETILKDDFVEPDLFIIAREFQDFVHENLCIYLKCRKKLKRTPVVLTGDDSSVGLLALGAGGDGYIVKPFSDTNILNIVSLLTNCKERMLSPV